MDLFFYTNCLQVISSMLFYFYKNKKYNNMKDLKVYLIENQKECKVYFDEWVGSKIIYEYRSNGNDIEIVVDIVDKEDGYEFIVNDSSIGLGLKDFVGCEDIDDCGIVIGKYLIQNNDSGVMMTIIPSSYMSKLSYMIHLNKNLEYDTEIKTDWTLTWGADLGRPLVRYEYFEIKGNDVVDIESMISNRELDRLNEYIYENDPFETPEFMDLWGDEIEERLSFEVSDENNEEVINGVCVVPERNVIYYDEYHKDLNGKTFEHPDYILMKSDVVKRSWCSFNVPRNFDINGIHFIGQYHFDDQIPNSSEIGDTVTSIFCFRYNGKFYTMDNGSDCGTWGDIHYSLFRWNKSYKYYQLVCTTY